MSLWLSLQEGAFRKLQATLTSLSLPFAHWDGLDWGDSKPPTGHVPLKKWDGMDWGGNKNSSNTHLPFTVRDFSAPISVCIYL